jgi:hypothetical protein
MTMQEVRSWANRFDVMARPAPSFGTEVPSSIDLNTLVAPSNLRLTEALNINNRGEIVGNARLRDGSVPEYLLIPNHPDNSSTGH